MKNQKPNRTELKHGLQSKRNMSLWTLLGLNRVLYGVAYLLGHIVDLRAFTLALSSLVYYFEISISTLIGLNVGCNSRIDVLWPTHAHTHTHGKATLSSLCYIFVLFLMWFPRVVYWGRRLGQVDVVDFVIFCSDDGFFLSLDWPDTISEKIANFNWSYGKRFREAICVLYTHTHT